MTGTGSRLRAYLVDDEPLALRRLARLLRATGRVDIVGSATDAEAALSFLSADAVDLLFLDIQMPGMSGFELLSKLESQPPVIFTTAFDQYALRAFEVNSVDYLLKPIEAEQLDRALNKIERLRAGGAPPDLRRVVEEVATALRSNATGFPERIASRSGDRVQFIDLSLVTHFVARDKLTYAVTAEKSHVVDSTIADLEQRLDPRRFIRIHRSMVVNLDYVQEIHPWFTGGVVVRLKDDRKTELTVARDRVRALRQRLTF
jgi:two-component system LytT family response regulator